MGNAANSKVRKGKGIRKRKQKRKGTKVKYDFVYWSKRSDEIGDLIESTAEGDPAELRAGIHSKAWALAIKKQEDCPLLDMPVEIRDKIWQYAIFGDDEEERPFIDIQRHGIKYKDGNKNPAISNSLQLSLVCRKTYVDVTGSALLYKRAIFAVPGPATASTFLKGIIPARKDAITSISIHLVPRRYGEVVPLKLLHTLAKMESLKSLEINVELSHEQHFTEIVTILGDEWQAASDHAIEKLLEPEWDLLAGRLQEFTLSFEDTELACLKPYCGPPFRLQDNLLQYIISVARDLVGFNDDPFCGCEEVCECDRFG